MSTFTTLFPRILVSDALSPNTVVFVQRVNYGIQVSNHQGVVWISDEELQELSARALEKAVQPAQTSTAD